MGTIFLWTGIHCLVLYCTVHTIIVLFKTVLCSLRDSFKQLYIISSLFVNREYMYCNISMYCTVQYCTVLYCTCTAIYACTVLYIIAMYCTVHVLQSTITSISIIRQVNRLLPMLNKMEC